MKTHEFIISWNSWALAYLSKDFTVPVDVVRVQFNVDCLFHPAWAEMGIMINKLYLIPEQAESGIVSMLWNSQGAFIWQTFLMKKDSSLAIFLAGKWGLYVAHSRCLLATFLCGPIQCCIWSNVAFGAEQTAKQFSNSGKQFLVVVYTEVLASLKAEFAAINRGTPKKPPQKRNMVHLVLFFIFWKW